MVLMDNEHDNSHWYRTIWKTTGIWESLYTRLRYKKTIREVLCIFIHILHRYYVNRTYRSLVGLHGKLFETAWFLDLTPKKSRPKTFKLLCLSMENPAGKFYAAAHFLPLNLSKYSRYWGQSTNCECQPVEHHTNTAALQLKYLYFPMILFHLPLQSNKKERQSWAHCYLKSLNC